MKNLNKLLLPEGLAIDDLQILAAPELWDDDYEKAMILALRRSGKFDAEDYIRRYPDVAENGMDPVTHYVMYGCHEGRYFILQNIVNDHGKGHYNGKTIKKSVDMEKKLADLREENTMLLKQLHHTQEELERLRAGADI